MQPQSGLHVAALSDMHLLTKDQDACSQKSHSAEVYFLTLDLTMQVFFTRAPI